MPNRLPRSVENIANQYDDHEMGTLGPEAVIPWEEALRRLGRGRTYWLASIRSDGMPHLRPVLAVLVDGMLYTTCSPTARKARNLPANPRFVRPELHTLAILMEACLGNMLRSGLQTIGEGDNLGPGK